MERRLLSGDEAVAAAARDGGVHLGTGYPGTPSTEILEAFSALGGRAQWAPNEKVALEVGIGAAFAGARAIVTMKHVGLNVAADPLFTAAYTGVSGALVVVAADDPGMASSQNEQDSRRYAIAAGLPMLEPSDSQEAYDLALAALELSERWQLPVLLRMTTRVCHSKSIVTRRPGAAPPPVPRFARDIAGRVMIPAYARPAHLRLRKKLESLEAWAETAPVTIWREGGRELGIIANGVAARHAREAAPTASLLELKLVHPLPLEKIRAFAASVERCVVVEEGDPVIADAVRAAGIAVEAKAPAFRFGELDVPRVRRILARRSLARAGGRRRASLRSSATPARTTRSTRPSGSSAASSRETSAATRSASSRRTRGWTPAWRWARRSAWGSGSGTCCRRRTPARSCRSSATRRSSTPG